MIEDLIILQIWSLESQCQKVYASLVVRPLAWVLFDKGFSWPFKEKLQEYYTDAVQTRKGPRWSPPHTRFLGAYIDFYSDPNQRDLTDWTEMRTTYKPFFDAMGGTGPVMDKATAIRRERREAISTV